MAYDSKLNRLYVTNPAANTVTALNVASGSADRTVYRRRLRPARHSVAVLPDGSRAYV